MHDFESDREQRIADMAGAAYHEAGHALAYMACGLDFERVEIYPLWQVAVTPREIHVKDQALVAWAGPMADYRRAFSGEEFEERWARHCQGEADFFADYEPGADEGSDYEVQGSDDALLWALPEWVRDHGHRDAERLLDTNWAAVERLAALLMERGVVTYSEAVEVVGQLDW